MSEILPRFGMILFSSSAIADIPAAFAQGKWLVGLGVLVVSAAGLFASIAGYLYQATKEPKPDPAALPHVSQAAVCTRCHQLERALLAEKRAARAPTA